MAEFGLLIFLLVLGFLALINGVKMPTSLLSFRLIIPLYILAFTAVSFLAYNTSLGKCSGAAMLCFPPSFGIGLLVLGIGFIHLVVAIISKVFSPIPKNYLTPVMVISVLIALTLSIVSFLLTRSF